MTETERPTVEQIKALGTALPPNFQVASGEVATILSGVVALIQHGSAILKAAENGSIGVANYIHDAITDVAEASGVPAPVKGSKLSDPPPAPAQTQAASIDYDKLAAAMVAAQSAAAAADKFVTDPPAADASPASAETSQTDTPGTDVFA